MLMIPYQLSDFPWDWVGSSNIDLW